MKFLIVNTFSTDAAGKSKYLSYLKAVKKAILSDGKFQDLDNQFFEALTPTELSSWLYDPSLDFTSPNSAKRFDFIDIVFINGKSPKTVWNPQNSNITTLLRMCLHTKKPFLGSGLAFLTAIYLLSSNLLTNPTILNKDPKKPIQESQHLTPKDPVRDLLLDPLTGDLYKFNGAKWKPFTNIGLHFRQAADNFSREKGIDLHGNKTKQFSGELPENKQVGGHPNEVVVCIEKVALQNPLFLGIRGRNFRAANSGNWDIHPYKYYNARDKIEVLARSEKCGQVIRIGNMYLTLFEIVPKYKETETILNNFVQILVEKIKVKGLVVESVLQAHVGAQSGQIEQANMVNTLKYENFLGTLKKNMQLNTDLNFIETMKRNQTEK
jgi:hypothetical protein